MGLTMVIIIIIIICQPEFANISNWQLSVRKVANFGTFCHTLLLRCMGQQLSNLAIGHVPKQLPNLATVAFGSRFAKNGKLYYMYIPVSRKKKDFQMNFELLYIIQNCPPIYCCSFSGASLSYSGLSFGFRTKISSSVQEISIRKLIHLVINVLFYVPLDIFSCDLKLQHSEP